MTSQLVEFRAGTVSPATSSTHSPKQEKVLPELKIKRGLELEKVNTNRCQNDFIPDDVLFSLTQPPTFVGAEFPFSTSVKSLPKPSNVWNFPKRREKLKHLTDSTICTCGAGQDVSFLYDVPDTAKQVDVVKESDPSGVREQTRRNTRKKLQEQKEIRLPDSLIPEEFHVVKNKGVLGLEYEQNKYSTVPEEHEQHLVRFPSLKPTSRWEVCQLTKTFDKMLEQIGAGENLEVSGATQMHRLLDLVKKEQDIYNIVFHELVRQVTVECVERGELLATLRQRYNALLSKVPVQVKSLHDEVMAQRALDRRLTEELLRFKTTIGVLTDELSDVKEHDHLISDEARATQEELKKALEEAKKASDLLTEYHVLYELQRSRLEKQVNQLAEEKELWTQTSYCLALKVIEETALSSAKRLQISEKAWKHLANHFTILMTEKDTEDLTRIQTLVDTWKDKVEKFILVLRKRDGFASKMLKSLKATLTTMKEYFEDKFLSDDSTTESVKLSKMVPLNEMETILQYLRDGQSLLTKEAETYGGDVMLSHLETMASMKRLVLTWTDLCYVVFGRHRQENGEDFPDKESMIVVNKLVDTLMQQFMIKLTGENGVARGIISLQNILETWETRFKSAISLKKELPEQEWTRFYILLDDWLSVVDQTAVCVGSPLQDDIGPGKAPVEPVDPVTVLKEVAKWCSQTCSGIDSEDGRLVETVNQLHTGMLRWMIQTLLRLAPDYPGNSEEAHTAALAASASPEQLLLSYTSIIQWLSKFTIYVSDSCSTIVFGIVQQKMDLKEDDYEQEQTDLINFKPIEDNRRIVEAKMLAQSLPMEAKEWIAAAGFVLEELGFDQSQIPEPTHAAALGRVPKTLTKENLDDKSSATGDSLARLQMKDDSQTVTSADGMLSESTDVQTVRQTTASSHKSVKSSLIKSEAAPEEIIQGIGADFNIHSRPLSQSSESAPQDVVKMEAGVTVAAPNAAQAFEALRAMQQLQQQLQEAEQRALVVEERAEKAELALRESLDREEALEAKVESLTKELEEAKAPPPPKPKSPDLLKLE